MSPRFRLAILLPLSVLYVLMLFVLPDGDFGIPGGIALILSAWVVWYLTWRSLQQAYPGRGLPGVLDGISPGELCAWVGTVFTTVILGYTFVHAPAMVAPDGGMAPEASAFGKRIGIMVVLWIIATQLLRERLADKVEEDERDRAIASRGERWARIVLSVSAIGLAVTLAFTPVERLAWARPMDLANLLVMAVIGSALVEYLVVAVSYWRDRR
jgi:uncharacterized membrane protein